MDPSQINEMLQAKPGVCQRYGRDQIICQNTTGQQACDLQGGVQGTQLQGSVREDRVAWKNWCDEYKRLLQEIVFDPVGAEFKYQNMVYRANVQFGFYNLQFNNAQLLRQQIKAQKALQGATVWAPQGIIVVISRPGFQYWTPQQQPDDQVRFAAFTNRVKELLRTLAQQIPAFPQPSRISYFSRPLAINLNDPKRKAGVQFGECENFLDELESDPSTSRK
jgi:hypothetical protein